MQSVVQKYLSVNPRRLNPFNRPHHDFVSSADADADAAYLAGVEAGEIERFYVTLVELVNRAGHYQVVGYDGYNSNTLFAVPVRSREPYAHVDDPLVAAVATAVTTAAQHDLPFRPELCVVFSGQGREQAELLERYAAGRDGDNATAWVSWTAQVEGEVSHG